MGRRQLAEGQSLRLLNLRIPEASFSEIGEVERIGSAVEALGHRVVDLLIVDVEHESPFGAAAAARVEFMLAHDVNPN